MRFAVGHLPARITQRAWRHGRARARAYVLISYVLIATTAITSPAWAGPTGGTVVSGQAIIQTLSQQQTLIKQSTSKAIINWSTFNILANGGVTFQQPSSTSIALNRVLSNQTSIILGTLSANGQVWLINPNGVLFGKSATVNAAGLLATTADIANSDFMSGNYNFATASANPNASIVNLGTIATPGGATVLAAPMVDNEGTITARLGSVALGAGKTFAVDFDGDNLLSFAVTAPSDASSPAPGKAGGGALVTNGGTIAADGGTVQITARAAGAIVDNVINTSGIIQANSVAIKNGTVILDGGNGGVSVAGTISTQGNSTSAKGGTVQVLGNTVALGPTASINASGQNGGGTVLIGGNFHGAGPEPNADIVTIAQGATIEADATVSGNGGMVAVWSQDSTTFNGAISAKGGPQGGNGGQVETSGHSLSVGNSATVDTSAPLGLTGNWLLDPANLYVTANGSAPASDPNAGAVSASAIDTALNGNTNVTLTTSAGATTCLSVSCAAGSATNQAGDITVSSEIAWSSGKTLTLSAYNNINIDAEILITGAGGLVLATNNQQGGTNTAGSLNFLMGQGSVQFTGTPKSGQSLAINGNSYTLLYSMSDVQGINNNGSPDGTPITGYYALAKPLNAATDPTTPANWVPIGTDGLGNVAGQSTNREDGVNSGKGGIGFQGTFNGLGNTISNLTVNIGTDNYSGVFGFVGQGATIENLGIVGGTVTGATWVGGLVAKSYGNILNDYASDAVISTGGYWIGGLVGANGGPIANSYATGTVTAAAGSSFVGGLAGLNDFNIDGTITNSYATGVVSASGSTLVGGLVGANGDQISNSYATGAVTGGSDVGGLVGLNSYNGIPGTIGNSYATGNVVGAWEVGGLAGDNIGTIQNVYASGSVSSSGNGTDVGGLVGKNSGDSASITNAYAAGAVIAGSSSNVGGLVGDNENGGTIASSYATGAVTGSGSNLGGLVGNDVQATIDTSYWTSTVNGGTVGLGFTNGTNGNVIDANTRGLTVAQLASALPTGFSSSVWGNVNNQTTPYLLNLTSNPQPVYLAADTAHLYQLLFTMGQMQNINNGLGGYYALANSLDALTDPTTPTNWVPIGTDGNGNVWNGSSFSSNGTTGFAGTFNGLGNTISNLTIASNQPVVGLFGAVGTSGIVENIGLVGGSVTGTAAGGSAGAQFGTGGANVGALVGYNQGTIANAYATTSVTGAKAANIGGLVGWNQPGGNIQDAFATGAVTDGGNGGNAMGGLVGWNNGGMLENVYATGSVSGSAGYSANGAPVGGLVGYFNGGTIYNAYATGFVAGAGYVGGLFGTGGGTVTNGYYDADTTGLPYDGVTGLHTADLQNGTILSTLGPAWGIIPGASYPYLLSFYPKAPQVVSGTVIGKTGGTAVTGIASGNGFGTATTGANGYYYFQLAPGTLPSSDKILTYVSGTTDGNAVSPLATATASDSSTTQVATGLNLVSNTVNVYGQGGAVALSDVGVAKGSVSDSAILYGVVEGTVTFNAGVGLNVTGGVGSTVTVDDAIVTSGGSAGSVDIAGGSILLGNNITTSDGAVSLTGPVTLTSGLTIDTTARGSAPTGATVTFAGTLDDSCHHCDSLTITAGAGDVDFEGRVGSDNALIGTDPGNVTITSANNVNMTMPYGSGGDGFSSESLNVTATGSLDVTDGYISTYNFSGKSGAVTIYVGGNVHIFGQLDTAGGVASDGTGGTAGNVTITAGGTVSIFDCCTISDFGTTGSGLKQISKVIGIDTAGYSVTGANQTAGNGGTISITGTSISLPLGATSQGGEAVFTGSTANGGSGGKITLTATAGSVSIGDAGDNGDLIGLVSAGGNSTGGAGGAGGAISITASDQISFTRILSFGGSTSAASGAGKGGSVTLTANATSGAAIVIYGNAESAQDSATDIQTVNSAGGFTGVTYVNAPYFWTGGTETGNGANVTMGSSTGALKGSSYVQLVDDTVASQYEGGSTVFIFAEGAAGGAIAINGPIDGTTAGAEALRSLTNGTQSIGSIGSLVPLGYVSLFGEALTLNGNITTEPGRVALNGGIASYGGAVFLNGPISLANSVVVTTNGANIVVGNKDASPIDAVAAGTEALTLSAGAGSVAIDGASAIGAHDALAFVSIVGNQIDLNGGSVTTSGAQTYNGPVVLSANTTLTSSSGGVTFAGTLDDSAWQAHSLTIAAGTGNVNFEQRVGYDNAGVLGDVDPGAVTITSAHNVNLTMPYGSNGDGFSAKSFTIAGNGLTGTCASQGTGCTAGATGNLNVDNYLVTVGTGNGGNVVVDVGGAVTVGGNIVTVGNGSNGNESGGNGGIVSITAGGTVSIGNCCLLSSIPTGEAFLAGTNDRILSDFATSIVTFGSTGTTSAGNGGAVSVVSTGGNIELGPGINTAGGFGAGSLTGGTGGAITLTAADGEVVVGQYSNTGALLTGNVAGLVSVGGSSLSGNGGNGANITVTAENILLPSAASFGGSTQSNSAAGGNGGNITLVGTASSGAAVTLYGESESPTSTTPTFGTLNASSGTNGAVELFPTSPYADLFLVGGTLTGKSGNITIGSNAGGAPLNGTSYIQLTDDSIASTYYGGPTVAIAAVGAVGKGGAILLAGPIEGTAGTGNLRLLADNGSATVTGNVGDKVALNDVVLGCCGGTTRDGSGPANPTIDPSGSNGGAITFDGSVTATNVIDQRLFANPTLTTTSAIYLGPVTAANMEAAYDLAGDGAATELAQGGTLSGSFNIPKGPFYLAGTLEFLAGFQPGTHSGCSSQCFKLNDVVTLIGNAIVDESAVNDPVLFTGTVAPNSNGAESFTWLAGTGAITVAAGGKFGTAGDSLSALTLQGGLIDLNNGAITTTGAQTYNGPVVLTANTVLTSTGAGNITFDKTVDAQTAGGESLTVNTAGTTTFDGSVGATSLASLTVGSGPVDLNGGSVTTSGTQTYTGAVVLGTSANLAGGAIDFASTVNGGTVGGQSLTLIGATITIGNNIGANTALSGVTLSGGNIFLSGNIMTANGVVSVPSGSIVLGSNVSVDTTDGGTAGGASIYISPGTRIDDASGSPGSHGLTMNAGTSYVEMDATVGGTTPIYSLLLEGGTYVGLANNILTASGGVTLTGGQVYLGLNNPMSIGTEGGPVTVNGVTTVWDNFIIATNTNGATGANINLNGPVDDWNAAGSDSLTLNAGNAAISVASAGIGQNNPLGAFAANAGAIDLHGSIAIAGGMITLTGPTYLYDNVAIATNAGTSTGAAVTFAGAVDDTAASTHNLTVTAGTGPITVDSTVGTVGTPLGTLALNSTSTITLDGAVYAQSLTTEAGGTTNLNGGAVTTSGTQTYGGAVTLGTDNDLTGTTVTFDSTIGGAHGLTVTGNGVFEGAVNIASLDVMGTAELNGGTVTTSGTQTYGGAVTLGTDNNLTGTTVTFDTTVGGAHGLTVTGDGVFGGSVNIASLDVTGTADLNGGTVATSGTQTYGGAVTLSTDNNLTGTTVTFDTTVGGAHGLTVTGDGVFDGSVNIASLDVTGTADLNGGSVTTSGAQTYGGAVTLSTDNNLTGTIVTFDSAVGGAHGLTVTGNGVFQGGVDIVSLDVTGTSDLNGGTVTTSGAQTYGGAVTLTTDTTLTGTGTGAITFASSLDGGHDLGIATGGAIAFSGVVGGTAPLGAVQLNAPDIVVGGAFSATSIADQSTTSSLTFNGPVTTGTLSMAANPVATSLNLLDGATFSTDFEPNHATLTMGGVFTFTSSYTSALTINQPITISGTGGTLDESATTSAVTVTAPIDGTNPGVQTFTIVAGNNPVAISAPLGGNVGLGAVTIDAGHVSLGANIEATGVGIAAPATLTAPVTLSAGSGAVTFASSVDGDFGLTVQSSGITSFVGAVGGTAPLASLTDNGGTTVIGGGSVTTVGNQSYGAAIIGANTILTAQTGSSITFGTVTTGADSITVVTDSVTLNGAWSGAGPRTLYPFTAGNPVTLAQSTPATFNLTATELGYLASGAPVMVTIGSNVAPHATGAITTSDFTFDAPLTLIGSSITIDPVSKDANTGNLIANAGTGPVNGAVNLATGDDLTITAGSSAMTGTVNGQSGGNAAQFVSVTQEGSGPFTMNGAADGTVLTPTPPTNTVPAAQTNTAVQNQNTQNNNTQYNPAPTVVQNNSAAQTDFTSTTADTASSTSSGLDSGATMFVAISPTTPTDLTASSGSGGSDTIIIAYANPSPIKPATNAQAERPQIVQPLGAYLNRMLTPTMPRSGVPGISFGYSLSGNSALW